MQTSVYKYRLTDNQLIATILIDRSEYNSRDEVIIAIEYIPSDPLIPPVTEPSEPAVPSDPTLPDIPTVPEIPQVSIP